MAVLNFAHLKRKPAGDVQVSTPTTSPDIPSSTPAIPTPPSRTTPSRTFFKIPAVMPSALLCATNYCQGCGRYLPATERDRERLGITYGQCLREVKSPESILGEEPIMVEVWKNIPASATVSKCYFFQKEN